MKTQTGFRAISSVKVEDTATWQDSIFLTFDIDWAHDSVLNDTIDLVEASDVAATWFVTHDTPVLDRLRANPKFELGIHPNFNFLLEGNHRNGRNAREVIESLLAIVPEATCVRSHSMTQSSRLIEMFKTAGLTHDCNQFIPAQTGIAIRPWKLWNDLIGVPYYWEDDVHCMYGLHGRMSAFLALSGLKVFAFHPIHVFLNTESLSRYESLRHLDQDPKKLIKHRKKGIGTRNRLIDLMKTPN